MRPGVIGPTPERLALAARVAVLRRAGLTHAAIGAALGISRPYAYELDKDPDGSRGRQRKDSYRGVCERCGGATTGSLGKGKNRPRHCFDCACAIGRESKVWTRDAVLDAIRRFAADHGRPPKANEWINGDPEHGYPARSSVYGKQSQPFPKWADAIEAAGFPRPRTGVYERTEEHRRQVGDDHFRGRRAAA